MIREFSSEGSPLRVNLSSDAVDGLAKKGDRSSYDGPFRCKLGHTFTVFSLMGFFEVFNGVPG
jgi:hypothetical protein